MHGSMGLTADAGECRFRTARVKPTLGHRLRRSGWLRRPAAGAASEGPVHGARKSGHREQRADQPVAEAVSHRRTLRRAAAAFPGAEEIVHDGAGRWRRHAGEAGKALRKALAMA